LGAADMRTIQKYNKELTQELGTIYASVGWQFFEKFGK